ncbi:uncharacterized protein LOC111621722 [Centruroides sculpturatus]|uniref:uncharacterized protein LOC111621722 n=1 Tax=Centruroides sculpturatus TaxID=218467 RepID=UPI000C6DDFE9|nr:uncharacterized protein LOC111621722 [Centruroides sculpturatus]
MAESTSNADLYAALQGIWDEDEDEEWEPPESPLPSPGHNRTASSHKMDEEAVRLALTRVRRKLESPRPELLALPLGAELPPDLRTEIESVNKKIMNKKAKGLLGRTVEPETQRDKNPEDKKSVREAREGSGGPQRSLRPLPFQQAREARGRTRRWRTPGAPSGSQIGFRTQQPTPEAQGRARGWRRRDTPNRPGSSSQ